MEQQKPSRHVCLTNRNPLMICEDPERGIFEALSDPDVFALVKGLSKEELKSPYAEGAFGMDEKRINAAIRKMRAVGLITSHRDGPDHVYGLNRSRFHDVVLFIDGLFKA